ncbi:MAG: hypothetical protein M1457_07870 [bacterium]|nr:hypothetical protein [bacterium]
MSRHNAERYGDWVTPDINNGTRFGRGMLRTMLNVITGDPVGVALIDKRLDMIYERHRRVLEAPRATNDLFQLGEDCGSIADMPVVHERVRGAGGQCVQSSE